MKGVSYLKTEAPIVPRASLVRWFLSPLLTCYRIIFGKYNQMETPDRTVCVITFERIKFIKDVEILSEE